MALAGLVARESSGVPRVGMLGPGPAVSAVPASWKVQVGGFGYVHQVAGAVQFSGLSADEQVDITPATGIPAGQARIDVVAWDPVAAEMSVTEGVTAVSPLAPSVVPRARVLEVRVASGDGMVIAGQVKPVFQSAEKVPGTISTVAPGYALGSGTRVERDRAGMVDAYVEVAVGSGQLSTTASLLSLPIGFRPELNMEFTGAISQGGGAAAAFVQLRPNGEVRLFSPPQGNRKLAFQVRFRAAP